jgi:hypothetical protein
MKYCVICGSMNNIEENHVIKRSQAKFLINCELNKVNLCPTHHRSEKGVHGREGHKLDRKLKLEYQNKLEMLLDKQYFSKEELKELLKINDNSINSLCKLLKSEKGMFNRQDILLAVCGGKLITNEEVNAINESARCY